MEIIVGSSTPPGSDGLVLKLNIHYRWVVITSAGKLGGDAVYIQYMTNKV
jgi:hypothetical protein